jgi:ubiquinone/menaquinone biosynthesis C-methylase UbiE
MGIIASEKDWDDFVVCAEAVARTPAFEALRDGILEAADLAQSDRVVDLGAGTGLLTLPAAERAGRIWAVDISRSMCDYLVTKAGSADLHNVDPVVASIVSLPLVDESADVAVSNYCFHHLSNDDKLTALREVNRVLVPGGRVVIGDMMFSLALGDGRNRAVVQSKVRAMLRKGPAGAWRLARNGARVLARRWESPATVRWWEEALPATGFSEVKVTALDHEGGIAWARKPVAQ